MTTKTADNFSLWQRWLVWASGFFTLVGVSLALAGTSPMFDAYTAAMDRALGVPESAHRFRAFLYGPIGGTIAAKWLLVWFVARHAFARRQAWAWRAVSAQLLAWFVLDSAVSLARGAAFNVLMINLAPLVAVGVPLIATRGAFVHQPPPPAGRGERWLVAVSVVVAVVALLFALLPEVPAWDAAAARVFFGSDAIPFDAQPLRGFLYGVLGATLVGNTVIYGWTARRALREPWGRAGLAASLLLWFVVDSAVSAYHGAWFNVWMVNVPSLVALGAPLLIRARAA